MIQTKVAHSLTKSAWNIIGISLGGKFKIARIPYEFTGSDISTSRERKEAHEHAIFISDCFNKEYKNTK
jgi:hypothetical protein